VSREVCRLLYPEARSAESNEGKKHRVRQAPPGARPTSRDERRVRQGAV